MKSHPVVIWALAACLWPLSLCRAQMADKNAVLDTLGAVIGGQHHQSGHAAADGPALALDEVERIALAENPEIRVARQRVTAAQASVPIAGALDDPQLMYRGWQVPLSQPWNYNQAQNMFMIGQALAGRGKRSLRTSVADADVATAKEQLAEAQLRVRVEARKAFFDLLRAQDELRIHDQHVDIAHQAIEAAKIKYIVGKVPQVEVLKAQVALTRLAEHMIRFERDAEVARARLNAVLGREPGIAVRVAGDYGLAQTLPSLEQLTQTAMQERPDLREAAAEAGKSRREQALANKTYAPDFNVAAGYMLMPVGSSFRNNYMVEGSMSLPWLNRRRHEAELAVAASATTEKDAEFDAARNLARGQIGEALAEAQAAQRLARVYQDSLREQAEETLHAAVIAYENDQTSFLDLLDSQMTVVDVDLAWIDALGEFNLRMAELEMVTGAPVEQSAGKEAKQ